MDNIQRLNKFSRKIQTHIEAQTDNIDDNAQSLNEGNTQNADSQSLITRPKRQTKASLKSVQNRMQTKEFKTTKSWDKVQSGITTLQTMPDSIPQIRFAISKVRAAFHDYHMSIVEVCKSDPKPIRSDSFGFRNQNIHFGSD